MQIAVHFQQLSADGMSGGPNRLVHRSLDTDREVRGRPLYPPLMLRRRRTGDYHRTLCAMAWFYTTGEWSLRSQRIPGTYQCTLRPAGLNQHDASLIERGQLVR